MTAIPKDAVTIWTPNPGQQTDFLSCGEREALFGGKAGSGKSDALIMGAARYYKNRAHRAILFRKTFGEMKDLVRRSEELYPYLGARYRSSTKEWLFPSGAIVEFGYLDKKKDVLKYKRAWNYMAFDELTHWEADGQDSAGVPVNMGYLQLVGSRLRSVNGSGLPLEVRNTTNPGNVGHEWVRSRYRIPDDGGPAEVFDEKTKSWRIFIPGVLCPQLAGTSYEHDLDALPDDLRRMLKEGRWDIIAGAMFREFDHRIHVCEPFIVDGSWKIWRGADDGYNAPACVLWFAQHDRRIYVIDELYRDGMLAETMAEEVLKRDRAIVMRFGTDEPFLNQDDLDGEIDASAFNEAGLGSKGTGRGQIMNNLGCRWRPSQKGAGSRIAGCNLVHSFLRTILPDGKPRLQISKNCTNLIRTLPTLPKDENNPEDVDTDGDDHCFPAGTLVLTVSGLRPIEKIQPGEMIQTRRGYFPAILSGLTGQSELIELTMGDGTKLAATGNHLAMTSEGWKRFDAMTHSDTLLQWTNQKSFRAQSNSFKAFATICAESIFSATAKGFTLSYSRRAGEKSKRVITSITKTMIGRIIKAAILSSTHRKETRSSRKSSGPLLRRKAGRMSKSRRQSASSALANLKRLFQIAQNSVNRNAKLKIVAIKKLPAAQTYNLTVAGMPEFFANGILVHNCYDALRTGLQRIPKGLVVGKVLGL